MKTYVIFSGIANIVAGGPIYVRNKIQYLKMYGWNVILLPIDDGKIFINGFEDYAGKSLPFLTHMPGEFSKRQLRNCLRIIKERIPLNSNEIVIESGTHYTSLWGELLAKELGAKHIVFWLDENNPFIKKKEQDYLYFKYKRNELACITDNAMSILFQNYEENSSIDPKSLSFDCTNSVEDYECPMVHSIPNGDYVLGSIGRLNKGFVSNIVDAFIEFAKMVPNKTVVCIFIGGGTPESIKLIKQKTMKQKNIELYITGYIYPIPLRLLKSIDLLISGAGSAYVSAKYGLPTIYIDIHSFDALGYLTNSRDQVIYRPINSNSILKYICDFFIYNRKLNIVENYCDEWKNIESSFSKHMAFIQASSSVKEYYSEKKLCKLCMNKKRRIYKMLFTILGVDLALYLNKKIKSTLQ